MNETDTNQSICSRPHRSSVSLRVITMRFPADVIEDIDEIAKQHSLSRTWIITKVLRGWLADRPHDKLISL